MATALPPLLLSIVYKLDAEYVTPAIVKPDARMELGNGCCFWFFQKPGVAGQAVDTKQLNVVGMPLKSMGMVLLRFSEENKLAVPASV